MTNAELKKIFEENKVRTDQRLEEFNETITAMDDRLKTFMRDMRETVITAQPTQDELKDAAADALVDEVEEAVEGFKGWLPVRAVRAVGRELKPGLPNHDHVKGGALAGGGLVLAARFIPPVRDVAIQLITP